MPGDVPSGNATGGGSAPPAEVVGEVLGRIADALGVEAEVVVQEVDGELQAQYVGPDVGLLIGHHGQTLEAIQHLAYRIAFRAGRARMRVVVEAGGYRERRGEALRHAADHAAVTAVKDGRPVVLEAMSASERRVVHEHLKDRRDIETYSQGEEPDRRLVVAPVLG